MGCVLILPHPQKQWHNLLSYGGGELAEGLLLCGGLSSTLPSGGRGLVEGTGVGVTSCEGGGLGSGGFTGICVGVGSGMGVSSGVGLGLTSGVGVGVGVTSGAGWVGLAAWELL
ncbi:MAG: hypothetical protein N5P05_000279 [Chroococcopsis gigantea SAG 12.99]|nr:hypothetical protein [Chroococcopsis gigantea SAG 12.99]